MPAHRLDAAAPLPRLLLAREPGAGWSAPVVHTASAEWSARGLRDLVPPATLEEARSGCDELAALLARERTAAADFLLALADFDRRRGWERLGHASLFAFLTRALGLSKGAAYVRLSAARLLPAFPEVEAALRDGRLCLSATGELARVLTRGNLAEVLPRYLGCSSREAREVTAALAPRAEVPARAVVTGAVRAVGEVALRPALQPALHPGPLPVAAQRGEGASPGGSPSPRTACEVGRGEGPGPGALPFPAAVRAHEPIPTHPTRAPAPPPRDEAEPLTADLRRLHVTVSRRLLEKLDRARTGLSHALPGATTEQVLEAALDLLLEKQARARALVRRPRAQRPAAKAGVPVSSPAPLLVSAPASSPAQRPAQTPVPAHTKPASAARPPIPAAVEREVRRRHDDRCQFPLDGGGVCGSTWQVELDHVVPVALGGGSTADNLRCLCRVHNQSEARRLLGRAAERRRRPGRGGAGQRVE